MTAKATVAYTVQFRPSPPPPEPEPVGRVPRVTRLLALGHRIQELIDAGEVRDLAVAARRLGLTRARVSQVCNLVLLSPSIQQEILSWPPIRSGRDPISERALRPIIAEVHWSRQEELWRKRWDTSPQQH